MSSELSASDFDKRNAILTLKCEISRDEVDLVKSVVGKLSLVVKADEIGKNEDAAALSLGLLLDCSKNENFAISDAERSVFESKLSQHRYFTSRALSIAEEVLQSAIICGVDMKFFSQAATEYESLRNEVNVTKD
jgi:hypothetical protein